MMKRPEQKGSETEGRVGNGNLDRVGRGLAKGGERKSKAWGVVSVAKNTTASRL